VSGGVRARQVWVLATSLLLLGACATPPRPSPTLHLPALRLTPASLGGELALAQQLRFERLDGSTSGAQTIDALLEADAHSVRVAGLALGRRVLRLQWDGQTLDAQVDPGLADRIQPAQVLRDLQLVWWPVAEIRLALPAGWVLEASDHIRTLRHGRTPGLRIDLGQLSADGSGTLVLANQLEGYRLVIRSAPLVVAP
jgi:hypothetical protein